MSVVDHEALEASPLADLHAIASELSIDGYRRLRKADLVDAIIARQSGEESGAESGESDDDSEESAASSRRRRGRRGGRGRTGGREAGDQADDAPEPRAESKPQARSESRGESRSDSRTEPKSEPKGESKSEPKSRKAPEIDPEPVSGVVELLANGSGFLRVAGPDPSDDDVYISAAQVKRCELVSGDTITGPRRPPQRSERFASLVRIDTINGRPAAEVADRARYDELPASFPADRFKLATEDETLKAIEFLTPVGHGSRVTLVGAAWSGKSHTLKDLARALAGDESLSVFVALTGVRPEELADWTAADSGLPAPGAALSFASSADAQDHAIDLVIEQAKRVATRGAHAVVLIDSLDGLHPQSARKALAAARNLTAAGSLTVIATSSKPIGGETTVIALDAALTSTGRFPALDLANSGTLRPELLVGEAGAKAIADARAEALGI